MTNYSIDDSNGNQLCAGLQGYDFARRTAQERANKLGEAVTLYAPVAISNIDEDGVVDGETIEPETVRCECGACTGERCLWVGDANETVVIEWMPEHLRDNHRNAGYRSLGEAGVYPHNGALRLRVERSCAAGLVGEWCAVVEAP